MIRLRTYGGVCSIRKDPYGRRDRPRYSGYNLDSDEDVKKIGTLLPFDISQIHTMDSIDKKFDKLESLGQKILIPKKKLEEDSPHSGSIRLWIDPKTFQRNIRVSVAEHSFDRGDEFLKAVSEGGYGMDNYSDQEGTKFNFEPTPSQKKILDALESFQDICFVIDEDGTVGVE